MAPGTSYAKELPPYAHILLLFIIHTSTTFAQNCYYPNGDLSVAGDAACSSGGNSNCCPYQWECMSNGLCYLENADIYGRYTCTDQSWQSGECTQLCTGNGTATGNEAILQCPDGSWCCDGDRSFNCCETEDMDFFNLPRGTSVAYISEAATPSSVATTRQATSSSSAPPTSSSPSETPSPSSTTTSNLRQSASQAQRSSSTSQQSSEETSTNQAPIITASASTDSAGEASTVIITYTPDAIIAPASATDESNESTNNDDDTSPLPLILGLAIGIPLGLVLAAILLFLLYRRRCHSRQSHPSPTTPYSPYNDSGQHPEMRYAVGHFAPSGRAPELDSSPVALTRSKSGRKSELMGSTHMPSPALSRGSGGDGYAKGNGLGLPAYSPGMQGGGFSPAVGSVPEQEERYELWGGYVPYRPPMAQAGDENRA